MNHALLKKSGFYSWSLGLYEIVTLKNAPCQRNYKIYHDSQYCCCRVRGNRQIHIPIVSCDQGVSKHEMKPVLLLGQIMFYSRIFNFQAQLGTRDIQKFDFSKVLFTSKKLKFMIWIGYQNNPQSHTVYGYKVDVGI